MERNNYIPMGDYESSTADGKCIFCEIIAGRITTPGVFWEDEKHMAFLSIDPNTKGVTVVIPKDHYGSDVLAMPEDALQEFIVAAKKVAKILETKLEDVGRVGLVMEGTGINHAHIKLYPMHGTGYMKKGEWKQFLSEGEPYYEKYEGFISSQGGPMASDEELSALAEVLRG